MPCFHAAGISARLSVSSLTASTTNEHVNRGGRVAKDKIGAAEWEIEHGRVLKESDLRCFNEDGRLHFLGDFRDMPLLCVGVDSAQVLAPPGDDSDAGEHGTIHYSSNSPLEQVFDSHEHEEDSSLTSLGTTPSHTPDRPQLTPEQSIGSRHTIGSKPLKQRPKTPSASQPIQFSQPPSRIRLINRTNSQANVSLPSLTDNGTPSCLPTFTPAEHDAVVSVTPKSTTSEPKALTLVTQLDSSTFCRTKYGTSDDIKLDVYFNGRFENCRYLASRDKRSAAECAIRFSGRRTHRVLEKTWTFQPTLPSNSTKANALVMPEQDRTRWNHICEALHKEADTVGFLSDGSRPPTGNMLQSLSQMPLPEQLTALHGGLDQSFGVIDLIVSLGEGKKFSTKEGYLHEPERLQDTRLEVFGVVKDMVQRASNVPDAPSTPPGSVESHDHELVPSDSTLPSTQAQASLSNVAVGPPRKDLFIPDPQQHLRAELGCSPRVPSPLHAFKAGMLSQLESTSLISKNMKSAMVAAVSPTQSPTMLRHGFAVVIPPVPSFGFGKHDRKLQRPDSLVGTSLPHSPAPLATRSPSSDMTNANTIAAAAPQSSAFASNSLKVLKRMARRPCMKRDLSSLKHIPRILLSDKIFTTPGPKPVAEPKSFSEATSKRIGFSLKLRIASPKKRTIGKANVFVRQTNQSRSQSQALEMSPDSGIVASTPSSATPVIGRGKETKSDAKNNTQLKRKMSKTDTGDDAAYVAPESKRRRSVVQSVLETLPLAQDVEAISPRKLLMPPPSSPLKSTEVFVIPELSRNCLVSYSDQVDDAGKGQGFRQIRACRGGNFKEKEILCAMRFVVL